MYTLQNGSDIIEYDLVRSSRKTISITINREGKVTVRAPLQISYRQLRRCIEERAEWIREKRKQAWQESAKHPNRTYEDGEQYLFEGEIYTLEQRRTAEGHVPRVFRESARLVIEASGEKREQTREMLKTWYIEQAENRIRQRISYFAEKMGESFGEIRIKEQKTLWGSCSSRRNLNFNWKLIMAPPGVLDYVVVHELCHLRYMNHSRDYWNWVDSVMPDYSRHRRWLKEHGNELEI